MTHFETGVDGVKSVFLNPELTIQKAASRARGDRFRRMRELCDTQLSVSTARLSRMLDELESSDRQDALHFKALADFVRKDP